MKILMLSEDKTICIAGSSAERRMGLYARLFDELHIVVLAGGDGANAKIGNLFIYATGGDNGVSRRWHMYRVASRIASHVRPDVVSAQGPDEIGLIAYWISRRHRNRTKLQLQLHTDIMSPWYRRAGWKERVRYLLPRLLLPRADGVRVVSEQVKHSLVDRLGISAKKICVLPIYADLEQFKNGVALPEDNARLQEYSFKMIAVGRFVEREKNFSMLIAMMRELVKRHPRAVLVLVGEGPDKNLYEAQIKRYGLEKSVILERWRDDLPSFYRCFDLLLVSSNYEGWGRVAIEAMAGGLPVVMTDVGLAGEVVRDGVNGRVVPVGDRNAFLEACLELIEHPEDLRAYASRARQTIIEIRPRDETEYSEEYKRCFEML